jgi:head-tail adaptor
MAYGKMNQRIDIVSNAPVKDSEGFVTNGDNILASVRAYREDRHGNEKWANMAAFSEATALFRFRKIPGVTVDATLFIVCGGERFNIISAEDVRGRGMYVETIAKEVNPSG